MQGIDRLEEGIRQYQGLPTPPIFMTNLKQLQAEAYLRAGKPELGLRVIDEAMSIFGPTYEGSDSAEYYRQKGVLLLAISPENAAEAEDWLMRGINNAQHFHALMFELRTALPLCRFWQGQGKAEQGRKLLRSAYDQFTEGFDTVDLKEAQELLS